jgi:mannose-6-phosphate isomerase
MRPFALAPNQLRRFYRGGPRIAALRGAPSDDEYAPEEWVGSTTTVFGSDELGLSRLPDGRTLRAAIAADPETYMGEAHVRRYGPDPAVLVKLLDAGQRLPVHFHPEREFARLHLGSPYGKTEAWVIIEGDASAEVWVGFREEVGSEVVAAWVARQDADAVLAALNALPVNAGDTIFVPGGTPHAIGEGILMVELQEPTDFSVLLEWRGFAIDGAAEGHLGLGLERALTALDRSAWSPDRLDRLRDVRPAAQPGVESLFPSEAEEFFGGERIRPEEEEVVLDPAFSILVVTAGEGALVPDGDAPLPLRRGDAVIVPFAAGVCRIEGSLEAIRCLPPAA